FFWTYHYGKRFEYLGHAERWEDLVVDGALDRHRFVALYCQDGMVRSALACQREHAGAMLAEAMRAPLALEAAMRLVRAD
ncbi:MAG: oxidoreductase C-terminal domain-containing protein, partial [Acetobacteraceae bacterium]